jgi:hypothetical protein
MTEGGPRTSHTQPRDAGLLASASVDRSHDLPIPRNQQFESSSMAPTSPTTPRSSANGDLVSGHELPLGCLSSIPRSIEADRESGSYHPWMIRMALNASSYPAAA